MSKAKSHDAENKENEAVEHLSHRQHKSILSMMLVLISMSMVFCGTKANKAQTRRKKSKVCRTVKSTVTYATRNERRSEGRHEQRVGWHCLRCHC